jgi:hypothetical protein
VKKLLLTLAVAAFLLAGVVGCGGGGGSPSGSGKTTSEPVKEKANK